MRKSSSLRSTRSAGGLQISSQAKHSEALKRGASASLSPSRAVRAAFHPIQARMEGFLEALAAFGMKLVCSLMFFALAAPPFLITCSLILLELEASLLSLLIPCLFISIPLSFAPSSLVRSANKSQQSSRIWRSFMKIKDHSRRHCD